MKRVPESLFLLLEESLMLRLVFEVSPLLANPGKLIQNAEIAVFRVMSQTVLEKNG